MSKVRGHSALGRPMKSRLSLRLMPVRHQSGQTPLLLSNKHMFAGPLKVLTLNLNIDRPHPDGDRLVRAEVERRKPDLISFQEALWHGEAVDQARRDSRRAVVRDCTSVRVANAGSALRNGDCQPISHRSFRSRQAAQHNSRPRFPAGPSSSRDRSPVAGWTGTDSKSQTTLRAAHGIRTRDAGSDSC